MSSALVAPIETSAEVIPAFLDKRDTISGLLSRAGQRLLDARTSAEFLEAKKLAEAALHYAKVTQAANETHADCLRIITRAEMRMANEIDRGQASGELRRVGNPDFAIVQSPDNKPATYEDLGVSRQRVAEFREVRDAGPEVVEGAIQSALAEGRAPTKADIQKHVRGTFGTGDNQWFTPADHLERARKVLGAFDLDPASHVIAQKKVQAKKFFDESDDGLKQQWNGRVWLNPPYAQPFIEQFIDKLISELAAERVTDAIALTHNYTDTAWFQKAAHAATAICFTRGRVRFVSPTGELASPTQGQAFFYFGHDVAAFAREFGAIGFVTEVRL